MKLTGITRLLAGLEPLSSLDFGGGHRRIFGVLNAARPALLAALQEIAGGQVLVVTAQPHTASDLATELRHWSTAPVALYPALESLPYERVRLDRALLSAREAAAYEVAAGNPGIVVAPVRALLQPVRLPRVSAPASWVISTGDRLELDALISGWISAGYSPARLVEEPGTFARRGGVIDVYPVGSTKPVRIELFGNDVESMRTFEPDTQRSIDTIRQTTVRSMASLDTGAREAALAELRGVDTSGMNAEALTAWLDDLGRLEAGAPLDDLPLFTPYLLSGAGSLVDGLSDSAVIVVDSATDAWDAMRQLHEQSVEVQRGMEESGDLPRGLAQALLAPEAFTRGCDRLCTVELEHGSAGASGGADLTGVFTPARLYAGRLRAFVGEAREASSTRFVVTSFQHERVRELLDEEDVAVRAAVDVLSDPEPGVTLLPESLSEGWCLPSRGIVLLCDQELFGRPRARPTPPRRRPAREAIFARIAPGDYVVHLEHGVGRFDSVIKMAIEGAEREYALIEYAGTDRVYVPTDQLERLTRYIGVGDAPPHLNRLGGGEWQRARSRAKAAAADIARELVDLYSKRMARPAHAFAPDSPWQHELEGSFAFVETPDQLAAMEQVKQDMELPQPMDRLVCADVGYGKTEVAVRAAFKAVMDGKQVAVLVPTTVLAQQHFETFSERLAAFPVSVEVLSRLRSPDQRRETLRRLATGEVDVVIGTHRLLQKDVAFKNLGLLIIDEEQRFGVRHKEQLKKLREAIDVLTLTATPIPRTLHMGLLGIREISIIETPPEGRLAIKTYLQPYEDRLVREAIVRELEREGQVYVVHNRVATIQAMAEKIRNLVPQASVLVAHGQMDGATLERVMMAFAHREGDVLVCSTIIENGLDIPNVNTIIVNNAHRLGLTQLYQLRGRVGRSSNQAYAYLLYPQDVRLSHDASRRMEAVFEAQELGAGMNIALKDLEIRGVGNLLGAEQSGHAAAIGFDLYTRLIGEAVEHLRGIVVEEPASVTMDLPISMYLPHEYVADENERLTLYRRLAAVSAPDELLALRDEIVDRFGACPSEVENLLRSVALKLLARAAHVTSIALGPDYVVIRSDAAALYDRVALHRAFGSEAKISTNVLRIPRLLLGDGWFETVEGILRDMVRLRESLRGRQPVQPQPATT